MSEYYKCEHCAHYAGITGSGIDGKEYEDFGICQSCKDNAWEDSFTLAEGHTPPPITAGEALDKWLEIAHKHNASIVQWRQWAEQNTEKAPVNYDGCRFPHCPNCNADLEFDGLDLDCENSGECDCNFSPQFDYCPYCGQKIDWREWDNDTETENAE
jgi:hypothetical protein